jgi:choline dehydrogenase
MQDHYVVRVTRRVEGMPTANEKAHGLGLAGEMLKYVFTGKGMLTYSASLAAASVTVLPESATPDIQCSFAPGSFVNGTVGQLEREPGITAGMWQMRPLSRGYVMAKTNRPGDAPAINPRYLSEDTDRRAVLGGVRYIRRLSEQPALAKYLRDESLPGSHIQSDDEILDYARSYGNTVYHATCTCMMGRHAMCVVDDELKVYGLEGLRVIDASVMPAVSSTNTNAPTIMIAEKGAAMIKASQRERLAA